MAFNIVSRGLLRTSREILERNMAATVGALQHQPPQQQQQQPLSTLPLSTGDYNNVSVCVCVCVFSVNLITFEKSV